MSRVTQRQVAESLGLSQSAVSLALRGDARIPAARRIEIRAAAERLGYRPDPVLGALSRYRRGRRPARFQGTVGLLLPTDDRRGYLVSPFAREVVEGFEEEAAALGYRVNRFATGEQAPRRLATILRQRGVLGVALAPVGYDGAPPETALDDVAVIQIGRHPEESPFAKVTVDHFAAAERAWTELRARGYSRIGFVAHPKEDRASARRWFAAYLSARERAFLDEGLPRLEPAIGLDDHAEWLERERPDVVICPTVWFRSRLERRHRRRIPDDVGYVSLSVPGPASYASGILQSPRRIGQLAARHLGLGIGANVRGPLDHPTVTVVPVEWHEGRTLRPPPR